LIQVREFDGPRGGEFYAVDLSDGRNLSVSRKPGDERVWLGRLDKPGSYHGQRGGIGNIGKLLDKWRAQLALDPAMPELYEARVALEAARAR
jgi:hypothetical protein